MGTDKVRHYPVNTGNPKRCVGLNISPGTMRVGRQDRERLGKQRINSLFTKILSRWASSEL